MSPIDWAYFLREAVILGTIPLCIMVTFFLVRWHYLRHYKRFADAELQTENSRLEWELHKLEGEVDSLRRQRIDMKVAYHKAALHLRHADEYLGLADESLDAVAFIEQYPVDNGEA